MAGYYLQPDGDYHVKIESDPWMKYWDKNERMNEEKKKFPVALSTNETAFD